MLGRECKDGQTSLLVDSLKVMIEAMLRVVRAKPVGISFCLSRCPIYGADQIRKVAAVEEKDS